MLRKVFNYLQAGDFLLFIATAIMINFAVADEFNTEGPYGILYFDTAGPFTVTDLNSSLSGDVNLDETINIQDILLVINHVLGNNNLTDDQLVQSDVNNDSIIDILDIISIVNFILYPVPMGWDFEEEWTGSDSYIFVQYDPAAPTSTALWLSSTRETLLNNSPMNVHYFFISNRTMYESDVQMVKDDFDEILSGMSADLQDHWNNHLHFVNTRTSELDNWLADALAGKAALAIDQSQKLRQIGYLGNPATFQGTYISYLAHEAVYFDYEYNIFSEDESLYDEITIFDRTHYTGGWAASIADTIQIPTEFSSLVYNQMKVELLRGCPNSNMDYDDDGCDDYDRIAHMYLCDLDGSNCFEITRWITPFDRQPHSLTDITPFLAFFRANGGQQKLIKFQESGWPNSLLTLKIRLYYGQNSNGVEREFTPLWNGTVQFNPDYGNNRPPQIFEVPSNATKVQFVAYLTGHGWGSAGCFNCCEFCNSKHIFSINGGDYEFNRAHPNASDNNYCMEIETIAQGVIPNQYGTWGYGRAGWCPGQDVAPYVVDITEHVILGEENVIDYEACRVSGNSCVTPPTCQGDGYCPEVAFSSYIIVSY